MLVCRGADLVSTCFTGCTDADAAPCGFFVATPPGTVHFTGSEVQLGNDGVNTLGIIAAIHGAGLDALNATLQFKVRQFNPTGPQTESYAVIVTDATGFGVFQVNIATDGTLFVVVGSNQYDGVWTPTPGGDLLVNYVTQSGVPRLFLNGVEVALTLSGINMNFYFNELILIAAESQNANNKAAYDFVFVDTHPLPETTVFCCPDGISSR